MENQLKERFTYYDRLNHRVIVHYYYNREKVVRLVFNFIEGKDDIVEGCLRDYMTISAEEVSTFLKNRRAAAWKRLCQIPIDLT